MAEQKGLFKKLLAKYDQFCEELGVNQGTCRGCVPVVKFDPEPEKETKETQQLQEKDKNHHKNEI